MNVMELCINNCDTCLYALSSKVERLATFIILLSGYYTSFIRHRLSLRFNSLVLANYLSTYISIHPSQKAKCYTAAKQMWFTRAHHFEL